MPPGPVGKQLPGSVPGATCLLGWAPLGRTARPQPKVEWWLAREGIPDQDSASALRSEVLSPMSLNAMLASRAIGLLRPLGWVLLLATPVTPWRDDVGTGVSAPGVICLQFPSLIKI